MDFLLPAETPFVNSKRTDMAKTSKNTPLNNVAAVQHETIPPPAATTKEYIPLMKSRSATGESKLTPMDPKLQQAILLNRSGLKKSPTSSTSEDEISVIASVTNQAAWNELTEVRASMLGWLILNFEDGEVLKLDSNARGSEEFVRGSV